MLLLFDIDGTLLIDAADDHGAALLAAMTTVYGVDDFKLGSFELAGLTDPAIARRFLTLADVDAKRIDDGLAEFQHQAIKEFSGRCPDDLSDKVNPGAQGALAALQGDHTLSLVTGNLEPIARMKLRAAGIGHHFADGQGGFGSDCEDRAELPPAARARAGNHPADDTVVIGDTPRDIACARADNVHVIAITTGRYSAQQLSDADVVIRHADDIPEAVAAVQAAHA